ncbi:hypothetical protein [Nostoc sp. FACHB-110]|uniref:hypothetical protein n=1 Tax=Nostoc sp. FACHB-110 TaxID=2692834 RepID=UPI0019C7DB46|nr:hypothetical protein [Nostoc sp. FACHB-110]MBD2437593.1 hypothetical protein [Nostoc sp. FACHB-110]
MKAKFPKNFISSAKPEKLILSAFWLSNFLTLRRENQLSAKIFDFLARKLARRMLFFL